MHKKIIVQKTFPSLVLLQFMLAAGGQSCSFFSKTVMLKFKLRTLERQYAWTGFPDTNLNDRPPDCCTPLVDAPFPPFRSDTESSDKHAQTS